MTKQEKRMIAEKAAEMIIEYGKEAKSEVKELFNNEISEIYREACSNNASIYVNKAVSILCFLTEIGLLTFTQKQTLIDELCHEIYESEAM